MNFLKSISMVSLIMMISVTLLIAQETTKKTEIRKINDTTYRIGDISIDKKKRSISFEATAEITEALVEYAIVAPEGKIHEALFVTKARPLHLNIAFKLLGFKENKSLYRHFVDDLPTAEYQTASDEAKQLSYFTINIGWIDKVTRQKRSCNINELIRNAQTEKTIPLEKEQWSYGGSFIHQGAFVAELNNDLIAIFTDRGAVANYSGKGREDDTLWHPVTEKMPAFGTKVTITITPEFPTKEKQ